MNRDSIKDKNNLKKILYILFGCICVGLGFIGVFVPMLPTTPFLLLAAFLFLRSSNKLYYWLMHHKIFGKYLQNYLEKKAIPLKVKIFTIALLWITILYSTIFATSLLLVRIILITIAILVTLHIISLKTLKVNK